MLKEMEERVDKAWVNAAENANKVISNSLIIHKFEYVVILFI